MGRKNLGRLGRFAVAAATVAALGFGGTQALATPAEAAQARSCGHDSCDVYCQGYGYPAGRCFNWLCYCATPSGWVHAP